MTFDSIYTYLINRQNDRMWTFYKNNKSCTVSSDSVYSAYCKSMNIDDMRKMYTKSVRKYGDYPAHIINDMIDQLNSELQHIDYYEHNQN